MDLDKAILDFLEHCGLERNLSPHTVRAYATDLADYRRFRHWPTEDSAASGCSVKSYLGHLANERGLGHATVKRRMACLKRFFFIWWSRVCFASRRLKDCKSESELQSACPEF